jgi:hypothetical protein
VPGVVAVGRTTIGVATDNNSNTGLMVPGRTEPVTIGIYNVDEGFLDAMGMSMRAGRWFDENRPLDDMTLPYPPIRPRNARWRPGRHRRRQRACGQAARLQRSRADRRQDIPGRDRRQ